MKSTPMRLTGPKKKNLLTIHYTVARSDSRPALYSPCSSFHHELLPLFVCSSWSAILADIPRVWLRNEQKNHAMIPKEYLPFHFKHLTLLEMRTESFLNLVLYFAWCHGPHNGINQTHEVQLISACFQLMFEVYPIAYSLSSHHAQHSSLLKMLHDLFAHHDHNSRMEVQNWAGPKRCRTTRMKSTPMRLIEKKMYFLSCTGMQCDALSIIYFHQASSFRYL